MILPSCAPCLKDARAFSGPHFGRDLPLLTPGRQPADVPSPTLQSCGNWDLGPRNVYYSDELDRACIKTDRAAPSSPRPANSAQRSSPIMSEGAAPLATGPEASRRQPASSGGEPSGRWLGRGRASPRFSLRSLLVG